MAIPSPRWRGDADLASALSARRKGEEQVRRLLSAQRPPVVATPGTLGGYTRATAGTVTVTSGGISFKGWSFNNTVDISPAEKPALVVDSPTTQTFDVVDAGWYFQRTRLYALINVPTSIDLTLNNASIDSVDPESYFQALTLPAGRPISGRYEYEASLWAGPFWLPGHAASGSGLAPFRVEVAWAASSPSTSNIGVVIDIIRGG
jgi:hypothetical protein